MKVLVYLSETELKPQGGPFAVGYYYKQEQDKRKENFIEFLPGSKTIMAKKRSLGHRLLTLLPSCINQMYWDNKQAKSLKNFVDYPKPYADIDFKEYDIIHFHSSFHLYREKNKLKDYKGIVILQTHSPLPQYQEYLVDIPQRVKDKVPNLYDLYEQVDKYAYERADYVIFPCQEAEEPYSQNWPFFVEHKAAHPSKFRYVLTGIPQGKVKENRDSILNKYAIPTDSFVMSYVGRHNTVKGYDILKNIASKAFSKDENIWVVSAGKESPFQRLDHQRWKEIGYTNDPASLISASDIFVLPNRVTYFDIVMMEILSLGKIVVASRTGGNKFFEKENVKGIFLYDSEEEAVEIILKIKNMPSEERKALGQKNMEFYKQRLTVSSMYDSYKQCLSNIYAEVKNG